MVTKLVLPSCSGVLLGCSGERAGFYRTLNILLVIPHHQLTCPAFCFPEQAPRAQARVMWRKWGRTGSPAPRRISPEARGECGGLGGGAWGQSLQSGPEQAFQGLPPPKTHSYIALNKCNASDGSRIHIMVSIRGISTTQSWRVPRRPTLQRWMPVAPAECGRIASTPHSPTGPVFL